MSTPPTQHDLDRILDTHPDLCDWGWWEPTQARPFKLDLHSERQALRRHLLQFQHAVQWLRERCDPVKTITPQSPTSRTLQQIAKDECPAYVGNGAMIAAVIYSGIPYKVFEGPNPSVAISLRSPCFKTSPP